MINISKIYTYDNFIEDVKLKFPDSYTEYSFNGFINKTTFFTVKHNCKHNHQWTTKPYLFLDSKGCSKCRLKKYSIYHFTPRRDKETFLKQQEYDKRKDEYCKNNNTKLIRIPYWEYKNINVILDELLK